MVVLAVDAVERSSTGRGRRWQGVSGCGTAACLLAFFFFFFVPCSLVIDDPRRHAGRSSVRFKPERKVGGVGAVA